MTSTHTIFTNKWTAAGIAGGMTAAAMPVLTPGRSLNAANATTFVLAKGYVR